MRPPADSRKTPVGLPSAARSKIGAAEVEARAGRTEEAIASLSEARAMAVAIPYPPVQVEAALSDGRVRLAHRDLKGARAALVVARGAAFENQMMSAALESAARIIYIDGQQAPQPERLERELETGSPGWWNIVEASGGWDRVVLVNARNEENARFEGRSIASIAEVSVDGTAHPVRARLATPAERDEIWSAGLAYYPGWRATVDGQPAPIERANYAFRAVYVPAGQHTVQFVFDPLIWKVGLAVSGLTLLGLVGWWGWAVRTKQRAE